MNFAPTQRRIGMPCVMLSAEAGMKSTRTETITANTTIDDLVTQYPSAARVFIRRRMHCIGCEVERFHMVADACRIYGQPLPAFVAELRRVAHMDNRSAARPPTTINRGDSKHGTKRSSRTVGMG